MSGTLKVKRLKNIPWRYSWMFVNLLTLSVPDVTPGCFSIFWLWEHFTIIAGREWYRAGRWRPLIVSRDATIKRLLLFLIRVYDKWVFKLYSILMFFTLKYINTLSFYSVNQLWLYVLIYCKIVFVRCHLMNFISVLRLIKRHNPTLRIDFFFEW
jgi:hypothetical protein